MLGKLLSPFRLRTPSSVLKLVHPGGRVECYYVAMPASKLMERYPSFVLAKPTVFTQPWDSIVQPEETLFPGQKFLVVPQRTLKKLRHRIQKPSSQLTSFSSNAPSSNPVKCFGVDKSADYDHSFDFSKYVNAESRSNQSRAAKKLVQVAAWHPALESISEL